MRGGGVLRRSGARTAKTCPVQTAREAIGTIVHGMRLTMLTKGQWSMIDLLEALLEQTGPADVLVSTWTTGIRDARQARRLLDKSRIRSLRIATDRSFPSRQPEYARELLELFGPDAIRCVRNHAKFLVVENEEWAFVARGSLNLNRNPRWEQVDLDEDRELASFFRESAEELWRTMPQAWSFSDAEVRAAFESSLGGGVATDLYGTGDPPKEDGLPDWSEIAADLPRWSDLD